jgi:Tfp pilus assembly PilM family ATPase/Tfp pilus assembly protein PilN
MKSHSKTALGIDLCEHRVSIALVERNERGLRVLAAATQELPGGGQRQPDGDCARMLSRALRQIGRRARRRGIKVALACSTSPTIMQLLLIPERVPTNIGEFVEQELKQCVALSGRDILSDFCGAGIDSGSQRQLLTVATDTAQVRERVTACRKAGAIVEVVEPAVLAYARALLRSEGEARYRRDMLIAVLGAHTLAVCLFSKGVLEFVRVREVPSDANTAESFGKWLADELRAVRQHHELECPRESREWQARVVVHDNAYPPQEIERLLAAEMGMDRVTVVGACDRLSGQVVTYGDATSQPVSIAAIGAALKLLEADRDELRINLLPGEVTRARLFSRHVLVTANAAALVFLGLLVLIQLVARAAGTAHERIEQTRVSQQLSTAPVLIAQERFLDQEISHVQERLQQLQAIHVRRDVDWPRVLNAVREVSPASVCITHLACTDNRNLSLKGLARSGDAAQEFVRGLEGRDPFQSVSLARLERQQDNGDLMEYQVDCLLKSAP